MKSFLNKFNPNNPKNNQRHGQPSRQKYQENSTLEKRMSIILFCVVLGIGGTSLYYGTRPSALNSSKYVSHMIVHGTKKHHVHHKKAKKHSKSKISKHLRDLEEAKQGTTADNNTSSNDNENKSADNKTTSSSKTSTQSVKSNDNSSKSTSNNQQPTQKSTSTSSNENNAPKSKPVTSQKQSNPAPAKTNNTPVPKK